LPERVSAPPIKSTLLPCDLCGAADPALVLRSERLDGPLVRCCRCGLVYVGEREHDYTFAGADPELSRELANRVAELEIVDHEVEDAESRWRDQVHERRADDVQRHIPGGRLLDVGCASGEFLEVAAARGFTVEGLEPDPGTSAQARERGLSVRRATLEDAGYEPASFDAVTLWHVIEHMGSPRQCLTAVRRLLRPGGVVAIETPAVDTVWFSLLRSRWRQLIPDHYYFFSRATIAELLRAAGFEPVEVHKVGKPVSLRFAADRVRRVNPAAGSVARRLVSALRAEERSLYLNPGDIMLAVGSARADL
jgi:2-polyprenyl-3-methyl-5-hydroxy-6-metoxy-1,4-benzoquinol methylase